MAIFIWLQRKKPIRIFDLKFSTANREVFAKINRSTNNNADKFILNKSTDKIGAQYTNNMVLSYNFVARKTPKKLVTRHNEMRILVIRYIEFEI